VPKMAKSTKWETVYNRIANLEAFTRSLVGPLLGDLPAVGKSFDLCTFPLDF
jgi:hypothetical protein